MAMRLNELYQTSILKILLRPVCWKQPWRVGRMFLMACPGRYNPWQSAAASLNKKWKKQTACLFEINKY